MPSPNTFVTVMSILTPIAALACICLAGLFFWVQFTFSYRKKNTAKTGAVLREANHKRNVTIHGTRGQRVFIKNLTKARYIYTVNGIEYSIRNECFGTKRQTPRMVPVVYNKRFPRFAYVDEIASFGDIRYGIRGAILLFWGICLAFIAGAIITGL